MKSLTADGTLQGSKMNAHQRAIFVDPKKKPAHAWSLPAFLPLQTARRSRAPASQICSRAHRPLLIDRALPSAKRTSATP